MWHRFVFYPAKKAGTAGLPGFNGITCNVGLLWLKMAHYHNIAEELPKVTMLPRHKEVWLMLATQILVRKGKVN